MRVALLSLVAVAAASPIEVFSSQAQAVLNWPIGKPGPPKIIDLSKYTIGQILDWTLHHGHGDGKETLPLHKLAWAVNKSSIAKEVYTNETMQLTLFAPTDDGLRPPHRREHEASVMAPHEHPFYEMEEHHKVDPEKVIRIINYLLKYHTLKGEYTGPELADLATVPTVLHATKDSDVALRLHLDSSIIPYPHLTVNFYADTTFEVLAKNGRIYGINHPLLPPPGALQTLLAFPDAFSTLTSAIQYTELDRVLAPGLHEYAAESLSTSDIIKAVFTELIDELVSSEVSEIKEYTVLAPTNLAFKKLGFKVNAFLFSPWGRPILKKLLSYHVLPGVTIHTDYVHNSTVVKQQSYDIASLYNGLAPDFMQLRETGLLGKRGMVDDDDKSHGRVNKTTIANVKTAFEDRTVDLDIISYRLFFGKGPLKHRLVVRSDDEEQHPIPSIAPDVPVRGGAIHVIPRVLIPKHGKKHGEDEDNELQQFMAAFA